MDQQTRKDLQRAARFCTQEECRRFIQREAHYRLNRRRAELIIKKNRITGLSPAEDDEYQLLRLAIRRLVTTAYPCDPNSPLFLISDYPEEP